MRDIETDIKDVCGEDPEAEFYFTINEEGSYCWYSDDVSYPKYSTQPDVLSEPDSDAGSCTKAARYKNQQVRVTIEVDAGTDPGATCSPKTVTYTFTVPNF